MKSYRFRLYPNKEQTKRIEDTLTTCRFLYNEALDDRIEAYKNESKTLSYVEQANNLKQNKNNYQKQVHSQVLQDTLKRLDKTYSRFLKRISGRPKFKNKERFRSFTYPQSGFKIEDGYLVLSKIGKVKIKQHRKITGTVKTCSIVRDINEYCCIITAEGCKSNLVCSNPELSIGIDVGISNYLTLSDGTVIDNPRHLKKSEKKLKRLQRQSSKKKKGSNNRKKQNIRLAKQHRKIKRQREDFQHKVSAMLVKHYGHIVVEKLNIKNMLKNHKLAKHISDCGWNNLIQYLTYKAEIAGSIVEQVNPQYTSQKCSSCGATVKKDLSVRIHNCPNCGAVLDRDLNAAINILNKSTVGITGTYAYGDCVRLRKAASPLQLAAV